jgi:hypothetical protein
LENLGQSHSPDQLKSKLARCLAKVPVPAVQDGLHRVIQLVNCSDQDLLGAADAAQQKGGQPVPVLPEHGTWVIKKAGTKGSAHNPNPNVLTIDIPTQWENATCPQDAHGMCQGIIGPRFWARTGCRYDLGFDKAQCETGGCGGRYDCSAARLNSTGPTTISEWTFAQPVTNAATPPISYLKDSPDISTVDGANLNMDIEPVCLPTGSCTTCAMPPCSGGDPHDPFDVPNSGANEGQHGHDIQWLAEQYPLTVHGQDVRASCAPAAFQLTRLTLTPAQVAMGNSHIGFVYVNTAGEPISPDKTVDNSTVACFSNCGRNEFPAPPDKGCTPDPGSLCYYWKSFLLG